MSHPLLQRLEREYPNAGTWRIARRPFDDSMTVSLDDDVETIPDLAISASRTCETSPHVMRAAAKLAARAIERRRPVCAWSESGHDPGDEDRAERAA